MLLGNVTGTRGPLICAPSALGPAAVAFRYTNQEDRLHLLLNMHMSAASCDRDLYIII